MRISKHTKIETRKNVRWNRIILRCTTTIYILYACTNVTKRVNRENKCKEEKRWKAKMIRRENTHSTLPFCVKNYDGGQPAFFFSSKQPSKLNPVTVEAMNIPFDLLSLVAPPDTLNMVLLSIHLTAFSSSTSLKRLSNMQNK